ncbi:hypothetical protein HZH66_000519 [Vespula vulgaris]|uniref:Uncharacterized protein n=1 Tax=Vespula vulgaris TaxID=7454 RepID=A0A834KRT1_VESVU|nr:hypothetical protein HZH66_000519 [Vespula vulgaris]
MFEDTYWLARKRPPKERNGSEDTLGQVTRVDTGSPGVPSYPTLYEISTTMKLERPEKLWAFSMVRRDNFQWAARKSCLGDQKARSHGE